MLSSAARQSCLAGPLSQRDRECASGATSCGSRRAARALQRACCPVRRQQNLPPWSLRLQQPACFEPGPTNRSNDWNPHDMAGHRIAVQGLEKGPNAPYKTRRASPVTMAAASESAAPEATQRRRVTGRGSKVVGTGSAVPPRTITNDDLAAIVETSDEWIATRTGIRSRHVLSAGETLTPFAVEAGRKALEMAGVAPADVDLVLMCTSSPDDIFGNACLVQRDLGCKKAVAFDLTAACSGFVLGLVTASRFIQGGGFENVLVVGADALSRYVDWNDRGTCILFGDGCGAALVRATKDGEADGFLGFDMKSDGEGNRHLQACVPAAAAPLRVASGDPLHLVSAPAAVASASVDGSSAVVSAVAVATEAHPQALNGAAVEGFPLPGRAEPQPIVMNGREVYKFAVTSVPQVLSSALEEAGVAVDDVDWLVLHQANQRILDAVAQKLGIPASKVLSNVAKYGNTSAASIPLALDEAVRSGKVKPGDVVAMAGFGAGLTWASAIVRYG